MTYRIRRTSVPPIDLRYPHNHPATHAENLWLSVVLRAVQDSALINYEDKKHGTRELEERQMAQDALDFLSSADRYAPVLAAAGLRPGWAMRQIRVSQYRKMLG